MEQPYFIVNIEGAIYKDEQWLMCQRSQKEGHAAGAISLIGGKLEYIDSNSDSLENALKREIQEEVGITVNILSYSQSSSFISKKGNHVIDIVFVCEYLEGTPTVKAADEIDMVRWMSLNEVSSNPNTPGWTLESLKKAELIRISHTSNHE